MERGNLKTWNINKQINRKIKHWLFLDLFTHHGSFHWIMKWAICSVHTETKSTAAWLIAMLFLIFCFKNGYSVMNTVCICLAKNPVSYFSTIFEFIEFLHDRPSRTWLPEQQYCHLKGHIIYRSNKNKKTIWIQFPWKHVYRNRFPRIAKAMGKIYSIVITWDAKCNP